MRILNVSAQKPDSTGSGTYLSALVRAQLAAGHEPAVLCGAAPAVGGAAMALTPGGNNGFLLLAVGAFNLAVGARIALHRRADAAAHAPTP